MRAALILLLCACGGASEVKLQQFRLVPRSDGFSLLGPDGGVLLDSVALGGAYSPAAFRANAKVRIESQYGSYRFTEAPEAWSEGTRFDWRGATATVRDAAGSELATLELTALSDGVLQLAATATDTHTNRASFAFKCWPDDRFLGFDRRHPYDLTIDASALSGRRARLEQIPRLTRLGRRRIDREGVRRAVALGAAAFQRASARGQWGWARARCEAVRSVARAQTAAR